MRAFFGFRSASAAFIGARHSWRGMATDTDAAFASLPPNVAKAAKDLGRALSGEGVPYLIAGGVALNVHGFKRATTDVDILVNASHIERMVDAISGRGWSPRYHGTTRRFHDTINKVDVDVLVGGEYPGDGVPKPVAFPNPGDGSMKPTVVDGVTVLPLAKLIELKLASGMSAPHRAKDLSDVQELIKANDLPRMFADELNYSVKAEYVRLWDQAAEGRRKGLS